MPICAKAQASFLPVVSSLPGNCSPAAGGFPPDTVYTVSGTTYTAFQCTAPGVWTQVSIGGGGIPGNPSGSLQGNNANAFAGIPYTSANFSTGEVDVANFAKTARPTSAFNFNQSIAVDLSVAGAGKTITMTPCPLGIDTTNNTNSPFYVYIPTTNAEAALVTGGTCTSGAASGTIIVTTTVAHSATTNTVQSAYAGIQEAHNFTRAGGAGSGVGVFHAGASVVIPPGTYTIYATIYWQSDSSVLSGEGFPILDCAAVRSVCLFLGDRVNANDFGSTTVQGITFYSNAGNYPGLLVSQTSCNAGVDTITLNNTGLGAVVAGDWVDVQQTFQQHYWGIHQVVSANATTVTWNNPCGSPIAALTTTGNVALEFAALEDNANASRIIDTKIRQLGAAGTFNNGYVFDNDQAVRVDGLTGWNGATPGVRCDVTWCGQALYAPGPFSINAAVLWFSNIQLSMQCSGNGITNYGGNTIRVDNSVIQGFNQWGIYTGTNRGGFGGIQLDNTYNEVGGCSNPIFAYSHVNTNGTAVTWVDGAPFNLGWTGTVNIAGSNFTISTVNSTTSITLTASAGIQNGVTLTNQTILGRGQAGLITSGGGPNTIHGGEGPIGQEIRFANLGNQSTQNNYCVVVHDGTNVSKCLLAGFALVDSVTPTGNVSVFWPRVQGTGTVTYDVLRFTGVGGTLVYPYNGNCGGGSVTACGSIATAVVQCSTYLCTATDNVANNTTNYAVPTPNYQPGLVYWNGGWVAINAADITSANFLQNYIDAPVITNVSPFFSEMYSPNAGNMSMPAFIAQSCTAAASTAGEWVSCPASSGTSALGAPAMLVAGNLTVGSATGPGKGRIIYNYSGVTTAGAAITLFDCNQGKTLSTPQYRASQDACDVWIGYDGSGSVSTEQLAMGAPSGISLYNVVPDGTSWYARFLTTATTFTAPTLTLGKAGAGATQILLTGNTSGTTTITGPAVAGTATNPITITNALEITSTTSGTGYFFNNVTNTGLDFNSSNGACLEWAGTDRVCANASGWGAAGNMLNYANSQHLLMTTTAPTISSGFGTTPSITTPNSTAAFTINVGTGGTATSGVISLVAASNGWACFVTDETTPGANFTKQSGHTTNTVTFTNYNSAGTATAWTASDILLVHCWAF